MVNAPATKIWNFVREFENWAKFMPGFQDLKIVNKTDSVWRFKVEVGPFNKEGHLRVHILEWNEPQEVRFTIQGIEEPLSGCGAFSVRVISGNKTELSFQLDVRPGGLTGRFLKPFIPSYLDWFSKNFANKLKAAIENLSLNSSSSPQGLASEG
jgi:carbon monoxide dehydrogenase subunit G